MANMKQRKKMGRAYEDQLRAEGSERDVSKDINETMRQGYDELGASIAQYPKDINRVMSDYATWVGKPSDAGKYLGPIGKGKPNAKL